MMKFKYVKLPAGGKFPSKLISLPLIEVTFPFANYYCLVDSGADHCFFHAEIGEKLGLKIENGEKIEPKGITGIPFTAYLHEINYKVGGWDYKAKVAFSHELGTPFGILGREGFFNFFVVKFTHIKEEIELGPLQH